LIRIEGAAMITIRKEMPAPQLDKDEFKRRYRERFYDPAFDSMQIEIDRLAEIAWNGYENSRKSPRTERAGEGFADPDYQLAIEWRETSRRVADAQRRQHDPSSPPCILLINGATRSEHTCPGESSKTWRLVAIAREIFAREGDIEIQLLDLSRLASEYGRVIYPCKTCVSTAMHPTSAAVPARYPISWGEGGSPEIRGSTPCKGSCVNTT